MGDQGPQARRVQGEDPARPRKTALATAHRGRWIAYRQGHQRLQRCQSPQPRGPSHPGAAEIAVTTPGKLGALCSTHHGHTELYAPPLPGGPLSDAGAGDSMVAALTTQLTAGADPVSACALGVATAATAMLTPSTEPFDVNVALFLRSQVRTTDG
ncbi:PfkB family carbohydrate kinase [Streptomyces erythrochromogenes]|uniref:PfkB family carbohydrate kinase n=1 Tax=Streptomyces erythrochromogenes TaxID=285574 RepID=UPI0036FCDEF4